MSKATLAQALDIMQIFDRLPDTKRERLLGVAEGLDMASTHTAAQQDPKAEQSAS